MRILKISDENDLKILRSENIDVEVGSDLSAILEEMFVLMHESKGVGLAAPQVGINKRFFVIEIDDNRMVFINPQIIETSHDQHISEEGCLSIPKFYADVKRFSKITISALNEKFKPFKLEVSGFLAVAIQHEYDHLEGKLFIDHLDTKKQEAVFKKFCK